MILLVGCIIHLDASFFYYRHGHFRSCTYAWGRHPVEPYDWAVAFETRVRELLLAAETKPLIDYENKLGEESMLAIPTPDHYLPLLYVIGTRTSSEPVAFPVEGVDGGSISMLTMQVG